MTLFHLFGKYFCSLPLKSLSYCEIGSRVLDSWYYVEKYQCMRVACYCYQKLRLINFFKKNFGKCSQIECFKVRNSTQKTLTLQQSPSNDMLQNKSFTGFFSRICQCSGNTCLLAKKVIIFDYHNIKLWYLEFSRIRYIELSSCL